MYSVHCTHAKIFSNSFECCQLSWCLCSDTRSRIQPDHMLHPSSYTLYNTYFPLVRARICAHINLETAHNLRNFIWLHSLNFAHKYFTSMSKTYYAYEVLTHRHEHIIPPNFCPSSALIINIIYELFASALRSHFN